MVGALLLLHCQKRKIAKLERELSGEGTSQQKRSIKTEPKCRPSDKTCRVCLKEGCKPILDTGSSMDLCEALIVIASIEVRADDPFPKYLCQACYALLQGAILFRKNALKSDKYLKYQEKKQRKIAAEKKPQTPVKIKTEKVTEEINNCSDKDDLADDTVVDKQVKTEQTVNINYLCKNCDIPFNTFDEYYNHSISAECQKKQVKCEYCNKDYDPAYYKKHVKIVHSESSVHVCDICGKKVTQKAALLRHRLTHFNHLPIKCSLCPYRGRFKESLTMHMRSHTGEKPYQCEQCPGRFISKSNLNKHMLTHKGKQFHCEVCGKGFYTKRDIGMHIKVDHTGIKNHVCRFCGKAFGYRKQVMKHEVKVHKREKYISGRMPIYLMVEKMKQQEGETIENNQSSVS